MLSRILSINSMWSFHIGLSSWPMSLHFSTDNLGVVPPKSRLKTLQWQVATGDRKTRRCLIDGWQLKGCVWAMKKTGCLGHLGDYNSLLFICVVRNMRVLIVRSSRRAKIFCDLFPWLRSTCAPVLQLQCSTRFWRCAVTFQNLHFGFGCYTSEEVSVLPRK